jgi:hypothetical protein
VFQSEEPARISAIIRPLIHLNGIFIPLTGMIILPFVKGEENLPEQVRPQRIVGSY